MDRKRHYSKKFTLKTDWLAVSAVKLFIMFVVVFFVTVSSVAENSTLFRIGTGGKTGVYYPIGRIIAQGITNTLSAVEADISGETGAPGYISVAQNSAGSVDNIRGVVTGEIEAGLVQADIASWAFNGEHIFKEKANGQSIRAIASLYPEKFQIVTRRDANIRNVNDLRGKRISVDEVGSGTLAIMRIILEAHGLKESDLSPVYLKPVFTHNKIVSGELQGFVMMAGAPMAAVSQLIETGISLVPIAPDMASRIETKYPYLVPCTISAGVYPGIPDTSTLQVHALLIVNATLDEEVAYKITSALWSDRTLSMLATGHPQGKSILPENALRGVSIPLHPGAKKYYMEQPVRFKGSSAK